MKKLVFVTLLMLSCGTVQAGFFDDVKTIVGGHIDDIKSRFADDQLIKGDIIARGKFRENDRGQDAVHHGSGSVFIVENDQGRFIQLAPDFDSTPGPDYHVYVSKDTQVDHEERFVKARQIELGKLIKGSGATYYKIPDGTQINSVTVWCKAFGEFITSADFKP